MKTAALAACVLPLAFAAAALAEEKPPPVTMAQVMDRQVASIESELVPLVEAMPEDKLEFKPAGEGFKESRTFRQQAGHAAGTLHVFAAALLGEDGKKLEADEPNGPASIKTKAALVAYVKDAFAHAHKAALTLTPENQLERLDLGPKFKPTRLWATSLLLWHSYDHYGQLAVYLRLNNIVPPASRK